MTGPAGIPATLLPRRGAPPPSAAISGPGGSGKTWLLGQVAAAHERTGLSVERIAPSAFDPKTELAAIRALLDEVPGRKMTVPAVGQLVLDRLGAEPWLLVIDDAHLLDDSSLTVLGWLAEESPRHRGGVVVAHRPARRPLLATIHGRLADAHPSIPLRNWSPEQVSAWADDVGIPRDQAAALAASVDSVPGLLIASHRGQLASIVLAEIDRHQQAVRHLAAALAVGVPIEALGAVTELGDDRLDEAMATLGSAGLVDERTARLPSAVAEVIDASLTATQRARLHRRAVEVLRSEGAPAARLVPHLLGSGAKGEEIARLLCEAADAVLATDPSSAAIWLDAAAAAGAAPITVAIRRAEAALRLGDLGAAVAIAEPVIAEAVPAGVSEDDLVRLREIGAAALSTHGRDVLALDRWRRAAEAGSVSAHYHAALAAARLGLIGDARSFVDAADAVLPETRPIGLDVVAATARGAVTAASGDIDRGLAVLGAARAALVPGVDPGRGAEDPGVVGALLALAAGRFSLAERFLVHPPTHAEAARARLVGAVVALRQGRSAEATAMLEAVPSSARTGRAAVAGGAAEVGLARRGTDLDALAKACERAWGSLAGLDPDLLALALLGELAAGGARVGAPESRELLNRLGEVIERAGRPALWAGQLAWWRLAAAVARSDAEAAGAAAAELAPLAQACTELAPLAIAGGAWAAVLAGEVDEPRVGRAADGLLAAGMLWEATALLGGAALRTTDPAVARRLLERGRELRAQLDPRTPGRTEELLSEREREVAALVLEGLTHKEIGARLYISPKTVEHHVANVRQKLGATSRAELLAALRENLS